MLQDIAFNGGRSSGFHQSVAECAVIGINDALRGQIPLALIYLIHDEIEHFQLEHEIIHMIRQQIGAVAFKKCGYRIEKNSFR
jgi:acyl-coenzyme A synthetase/AMP-(fatty) acid ligase